VTALWLVANGHGRKAVVPDVVADRQLVGVLLKNWLTQGIIPGWLNG